jgi:hypothetical protein
MLKSPDVADSIPDGSTATVSPVKRLITMYNSSGESSKKSRKKIKEIDKRVDNIKKNFEVARKEFDELEDMQHNFPDSGDNSPYGESDICSIDDTPAIQIADTLLSKSDKKVLPLSIDISRENGNDPSEIFWEVQTSVL